MSEVDEQGEEKTQAKNHSQDWKRQRQIFLEEKNVLSVLTGKRKPKTPHVELRKEVSISFVRISVKGTVKPSDSTKTFRPPVGKKTG